MAEVSSASAQDDIADGPSGRATGDQGGADGADDSSDATVKWLVYHGVVVVQWEDSVLRLA
jgi:hypothetical protein